MGDTGLDPSVRILVPVVGALVRVAEVYVEHRARHEQMLEGVGDGDAVAAMLFHHGMGQVLEVFHRLQHGGAFLFIPVLAHPHIARVVDDAVVVDRHAVQFAVHHAGLDGVGIGLFVILDALAGILLIDFGDVLDRAGLDQLTEGDIVAAEHVRQIAGGDGHVQLLGVLGVAFIDPVIGDLDAQVVVPAADPVVVALVLAVFEHHVRALALDRADVDDLGIGLEPVAFRRLDILAGAGAPLADGDRGEVGQRAACREEHDQRKHHGYQFPCLHGIPSFFIF